MEDHADDDAGETSAAKPPDDTKHEVTTHIVTGVSGARLSDSHKRRHEEQRAIPVASMDYGFFTKNLCLCLFGELFASCRKNLAKSSCAGLVPLEMKWACTCTGKRNVVHSL